MVVGVYSLRSFVPRTFSVRAQLCYVGRNARCLVLHQARQWVIGHLLWRVCVGGVGEDQLLILARFINQREYLLVKYT